MADSLLAGSLQDLADDIEENTTSLSNIFKEEPVPLDVFVVDKKFMGSEPLGDIQFDAVKHLERVLYPDVYPKMAEEFGEYWDPLRMVNFGTLQWGKGSGKDYVCRVVSMRVAYLLGCLHSPQTYFGIPTTDNIHLLNVASSAPQAKRAFFKPLWNLVHRDNTWFSDKCHATQDTVQWEFGVEQVSGHSDADLQEGLNILLGVADEIDAFPTEEEARKNRGNLARMPTNSAEAILEMLRTSGASRFPETFKVVRISYPRYKGSTIQTLTWSAREENEERGEESRHYVSGPHSTWEVNPRHFKTGKKAFAEDYRTDPTLAKAKYECDPEFSDAPFFRNQGAWDTCVRECESIGLEYWFNKRRQSWEVAFDIPSDLVPIMGAQYAMHGDIGINGDRAGVAMAHVKRWDESSRPVFQEDLTETTSSESLPYLHVDFACWFEADIAAEPVAREVQIRWYRELLKELKHKGFNIRRYTFDGFQSVDIIQQLEYAGVESERVSMDINDLYWKNFRDLVYQDRVSLPTCNMLRTEAFQLTRTIRGKIDHIPGGSKDVADAVAGSLVGALELGGSEDPKGKRNWLGGEQAELPTDYYVDIMPVEMPFTDVFSFGEDPIGMGAGAWRVRYASRRDSRSASI